MNSASLLAEVFCTTRNAIAMPDPQSRTPLYAIAALLFLGLAIIAAGSGTGDMPGKTATHQKDSGQKVGADRAKRHVTGDVAETGNYTAPADIDKTPLGSVPHKALYRISMIEKHGGARVSNISGRMAFEWRPVCAGWLSRHRFNLSYEYPDSPGARVVSRYTTLEAYDGSRMDFISQRWRNGEMLSEFRGQARRVSDGEGYKVSYNVPEGGGFTMPGDVMFPMEHTFALLKAARNGETFFNRSVFDGHDEDGEVRINAFIGDTVNAMARIEPSRAIDTSLVNTKAWHMRMAFFPEHDNRSVPDYELSANLHDNGVISRMDVAYDDFSIRQELVALEKLEVETCE